MDKSRIRNFCIIAHIDHGKSTLARARGEKVEQVLASDQPPKTGPIIIAALPVLDEWSVE